MYSNAGGKRQRVSLGEYGRIEDGKVSAFRVRLKVSFKFEGDA